ncbi:hypothetical protein ACIPSE_20680 [Streptomyces sp. NPDC090106]|uniref:hypothetical protein n=1 Tax=Streptomyces sp. NPDC090106 TaxID=3365946 RepID=UPI0037FDA2AF
MTRRSDRAGRADGAGTPDGRAHVVAVVVPEPRDAVAVVEREAPGAEIAVICLRPGAKDGRALLDRALAEAGARGCRTLGGPRVLDAADPLPALREELRAIDPDRLHTLDPDPVHSGLDEASGVPSYDVPEAHAEAAALALAAGRDHQAATGRPLYVDCLRADGTPRYPAPVNWLSAGFDGRLTAFRPTAAGVVRWYEEVPGGRLRGPEPLEGHGLLPGLQVLRDPRGLPHLIGLRRTARGDGGVDVEVVHAAQYRTGRPLSPWLALGGPNAGAWRKGREVGFPTAAFDAAGDLHVFVRNFGHSVSYRRRSAAEGTWTPWQHLSGLRVADDLVAVTAQQGGVELFARARDTAGVLRWHLGPDGAWTEDRTVPFAALPGTLTPAAEPGAVLFRDARTGRAGHWRPGTPGPYPLDAPEAGSGPFAVARGVELAGWGYSVLVGREPDGACSLGAHPAGRPDTGVWWQDVGAPSYDVPAVAVSRAGRLAVARRLPGGRLAVSRRDESREGLVMGGWRIAGD